MINLYYLIINALLKIQNLLNNILIGKIKNRI